MTENPSLFPSGIRDNRERGTVGEFLESQIENGSSLSIVSAYFTIYAFEALKSSYLESVTFAFCSANPDSSKSLTPTKRKRNPSS